METLTSKYDIEQVEIRNLRLDMDNARWEGTAQDEAEAVSKLLDDFNKIKKMQNMVNNFADRLTLDLPLLAIKIDGQNIVKDGNRRLLALKFLTGDIKNKLLKSPDKKNIKSTTKVLVLFYKKENDLMEAIQTIHGSGQLGSGLEQFRSIEKQRINSKNSNERWALKLLEDVHEKLNIKKSDKTKLYEQMNFTNFERMLSSKEIKEYFGIKKQNGEILYDSSKANEILKIAKKSKDIKVQEIYDSRKAIKKVKTILGEKSLNKNEQYNAKKVNRLQIKKSAKLKSPIINSSLSKINDEEGFYKFAKALKKIKYNDNLEISGPLYRVLLDYSIRYYCDKNEIEITKSNKNKTNDLPLWEIIEKSINHMKKNSLEKANADRVLKDIKQIGSSSITFLNKVIHNYDFVFTTNEFEDIKKVFDNIILFVIGK